RADIAVGGEAPALLHALRGGLRRGAVALVDRDVLALRAQDALPEPDPAAAGARLEHGRQRARRALRGDGRGLRGRGRDRVPDGRRGAGQLLRERLDGGRRGVDLEVHLVLAARVRPAPADHGEVLEQPGERGALVRREGVHLPEHVARRVEVDGGAGRVVRVARRLAADRAVGVAPVVAAEVDVLDLAVEALDEGGEDRRDGALADAA